MYGINTVAVVVVVHNESLFSSSVHAKIEEKLVLAANRDGGLESMELSGMLTVRISEESFGRIKLAVALPPAATKKVRDTNN